MTKLKLDLRAGILEVEGEDDIVRLIYEDFKKQLSADSLTLMDSAAKGEAQSTPAATTQEKKVVKKASTRTKESHSFVKDLDLSSKSRPSSLKAFYSEKKPVSAMEHNLVFVYYLQKLAGVGHIGLDHLYTCYKDVGVKVPVALKQSVADTSSRKGWLTTKSFEDIKLAIPGENYVEHDLPGTMDTKR